MLLDQLLLLRPARAQPGNPLQGDGSAQQLWAQLCSDFIPGLPSAAFTTQQVCARKVACMLVGLAMPAGKVSLLTLCGCTLTLAQARSLLRVADAQGQAWGYVSAWHTACMAMEASGMAANALNLQQGRKLRRLLLQTDPASTPSAEWLELLSGSRDIGEVQAAIVSKYLSVAVPCEKQTQ